MTPTPDDEAGLLTEKVMSRFKEYAILLPYEAAYNRMYEHVYRVLSAHLKPEAGPVMTSGVALPPPVVRALEFYADPAVWTLHPQSYTCRAFHDNGGHARSALRAVGK